MKLQLFIKTCVLAGFTFTSTVNAVTAQNYEVKSPNKELKLTVNTGEQVSFTVTNKGFHVMKAAKIALELDKGSVLGNSPKFKKKKLELIDETITVQVPYKDASIKNVCNQLSLSFRGNFEIIFRVYNDGIAYRFIDNNSETAVVANEDMELIFPEHSLSYFPQEESMYSENERLYNRLPISKIKKGDFCSLPVMFNTGKTKVLFTEASLHDYPGMFLAKGAVNTMVSQFPKHVLEAHYEKNPLYQNITNVSNFIAKVSGPRSYPWRLFIISDDDCTFVESNLVTQLSGKSKIKDASWIKPGKVAWGWWSDNNIYGVDFKAGKNQATYKYYIDFASENNIEYIILDGGWSKSDSEIYESIDEIDIPELVKYGKSKNVGVILWVGLTSLNKDLEGVIKHYSNWGIAGIKVDFMLRSDQFIVKSYENIAEIAAKYKFLVDFHGSFKPAGIERVWPNVLTYEGVMGNEQNKWEVSHFDYSDNPFPITPEHNVTIPFIRMAAGPMDFTPGAMTNVNKNDYNKYLKNSGFSAIMSRPMAFGSRAHQVAMFVVFESPLQMMCDSPTLYKKEQETTDFITQIPTTWDETVVLKAAVSDYIVLARRKGEIWFLGAMTDWTARDFDIDLSFLGEGKYDIQIFRDGINTDRNAMDYKFEKDIVQKDSKIHMSMSSGGGWAAIIKKE